jgi:two-component system, cell cycle sensor histidine kinase and response regulator CckA
MHHKAGHLFSVGRNILTSGADLSTDRPMMGKLMLINLISITGLFCMIPLGCVAFVEGNALLGTIDFLTALALLMNLVILRRTQQYAWACMVGTTIAGAFFFFLLATGGVNNTAALWYYTFPLFSSFLMGSRKGAVATGILFLLAVLFFMLHLDRPYLAHYSDDWILRFIPSFIVVFIYSYAFEYFREQAESKLMVNNEELNRTVEELKETGMQLQKARDGSESLVRERTAELSRANRDLKSEIEVREHAEHTRRQLETQLAHAQKMEAIGTLAGGVAHDLNNVLSATVGYPDLLLLDLPEDSPLRPPILTIRESGLKAAAIVQDLLTLARRGVMATEVVSLNQVVEGYLDSPEFKRLKESHPRATIEHLLDPDLLNLVGSSVHLFKTLMNLVNNAVEAMPDGGRVRIATESRYVDIPIRGYDQIQEGDYSVLSVTDMGHGIAPEDLKRIFEPFFTKKVMGRSGTGLGMSVVWGTVKDHQGYLDVHSTEGEGTTFSLYFPSTRQPAGKLERVIPTDEYMGNGESVLVVDDIPDQREMVCRILSKLGYCPVSVASGEAALAYLKDQSADLLILDMIMEPGIDGLETYQQILAIHPGQKAIIASGFSATDRVKELQSLGAGAYVKKPYTLERIGLAVKAELSRA